MAAGSIILTADGKRRLTPAGKLLLSDGVTPDPCGCCGCPDCANCTALGQATPCKVLLTILGLTLCPGCIPDIVPGQWVSWDVAASFDGSYCLSEDHDNPCNWVGAVAGVVLNVYSDADCAVLVKQISDWTVEVGNGFGGPIGFDCLLHNVTDPDGIRTITNAPAFAAADCVDGGSGLPTAGVCGVGGSLSGSGGTWTATPNGC